MTIPEWVMVTLVTCILAVIGWGVTRLVAVNDATNDSLKDISDHLSVMNGRLWKTETMMALHAEYDEVQFKAIQETTKELWYAINQRKA